MKKGIVAILLLATLLFGLLLWRSDPLFHRSSPRAVSGVLDLSGWDFERNGTASLSGQWACYDGRLLAPADFSRRAQPVPSRWIDPTAARLSRSSLSALPAKGVRTLRLTVRVSGPDQVLALHLDGVRMSSRVYVNGVLKGGSGVPSAGKAYRARPAGYDVFFKTSGGRAEILLQAANWDDPLPGAPYTALLGRARQIRLTSELTSAIELSGTILSVIFAFFYFCIYLGRRELRWFCPVAFEFLGLSLLMLTGGSRILYQILPSLPFEAFAKLQWLSLLTALASIIAYVWLSVRGTLPLWFKWAASCFILLYLAAVLALPYSVFSYLRAGWTFFLLFALAVLFVFARRYRRTIASARDRFRFLMNIFCAGALTFCFLNNFLYDDGWVTSKYLGSLSFCLFFLLSTWVIALRLIGSIESSAQSELKFLQAQIQPHFIYNTLNAIISFCYTDGEQAARLLTRFSQYLRFLFDAGGMEGRIPLRRELNLIAAYADIVRARFGDTVRVRYDVEPALLEQPVPPMVLQPLVENAVKHGLRKKRGGGTVTVSAILRGRTMQFCVRDDGAGMPPETLRQLRGVPSRKTVFPGRAALRDRLRRSFVRTAPGQNTGRPDAPRQNAARPDQPGQGIGLQNVRRRLRGWRGAAMTIESVPGKGTAVTITAPAGSAALKAGKAPAVRKLFRAFARRKGGGPDAGHSD